MRFRAIIREDDAGMACNVGGAVYTRWRSVEFDCPALSEVMAADTGSYRQRQIMGVELISAPSDPSDPTAEKG